MESEYAALSTEVATNGTSPVTVPALINGKEEILSSTFDVVGPYSGTVVWKGSSASQADAIRAVEAAEAAFPAWSNTKPAERRRLILKAADLMEERVLEIAAAMRTEMGTDVGTSLDFVTRLGISHCRDAGARATTIEGSIIHTEVDGQSALAHKVPVGVCLGIVPWNAPTVFANRSTATALAAGCTTVIKASELTPKTYHTVLKCYLDAGVPPGVVNLISCRPQDAVDVTRVMIEHPAVRKINFTGSTGTGRKIAATCAMNLKPCVMELGGKNSAIVLDDANLETAATQVILGGFLNSGQICMSTDRVIVQSTVADKFQTVLCATMSKIFPSTNPPPTLVNATSKQRVEKIVADAKGAGAEVVAGDWNKSSGEVNGNGNSNGNGPSGVFSRPIVVKNATTEMSIWNEEVFGSVIAITKVETEQEAIKLANSTEYGLSSAVFTEDLRRGMRVAKQIDAGFVHINRMTVQDSPSIPFGGVKNSGWGRFNNKEGLEEFLTTKTVTWMD